MLKKSQAKYFQDVPSVKITNIRVDLKPGTHGVLYYDYEIYHTYFCEVRRASKQQHNLDLLKSMKAGFTAFYHNALHLTGMHCATKYARGLQGTASVREGFPVVYMNFSFIRKVTSSFCFHLLHHAIMHDSVSHSMSLSFQDFL